MQIFQGIILGPCIRDNLCTGNSSKKMREVLTQKGTLVFSLVISPSSVHGCFFCSKSDILEMHHPCYCLDWHIVLQVLGFRGSDGLEVLRRESPTQGQNQLYSPDSRPVFADQKEFGWFLVGAGLCSSTTGTEQGKEVGAPSSAQDLSTDQEPVEQMCCVTEDHRNQMEVLSLYILPKHKQSPNSGFSITVSSPAQFLNWKPSTNPIAF